MFEWVCFLLLWKLLFLILLLILNLYFFVNWSLIFRITTKEKKNMVDSGFVNYGWFRVAYTYYMI